MTVDGSARLTTAHKDEHERMRSVALSYVGELAEDIARGAVDPVPLRGPIAPIEAA